MDIKFIDNSDKVQEEFRAKILGTLEGIGVIVEERAKGYAPVDTGNLRDHIQHAVAPDESAVYIGTRDENVDYAIYQEIGTHKMPARPFLKPAVLSVAADIPKIVKAELQDKN